MSDWIWSIAPHAEPAATAVVAAYLRYCASRPVGDAIGINDGPASDGLPLRVDSGLAVVSLMGPMMRRAGPIARMFGIAGTDGTRLAVEAAILDPDVERILLRVDSPGGSVSGVRELADTVASSPKPVTAQVEGTAASAAYFVASQADEVVSGSTDLIGSIGTRVMLYDYSRMFEQEGIEAIPIDTGPFKSAGALGTKITAEQRADFQRLVDFYGSDFIDAVARGRETSLDAVKSVADGRVFPAPEAMALGLIDGIATYGDTLRRLRSMHSRSTDSARARLRL